MAITKSEELFELFCAANGLTVHRIPNESHRTPDYIVSIDNTSIVVEVKQFDPGPTESITLRKSADEWGEPDAFCPGIPGERVRSKIDSALPQLKRIAGDSMPAMLVLYDNVRLWPEICDSYAIAVAMNGIEGALISSEEAPEGGARIIARWHGPSRRTTPTQNTTLSAIGMIDELQGMTTLSLFHNYFARNPIPRKIIRRESLRHFWLERSPEQYFSDWASESDCAS
jgi:hypothetical protein